MNNMVYKKKGKSRKKKDRTTTDGEDYFARTKIPRDDEVFGIIEARLGGNKMSVRCSDGKLRIGRVPGKYSRRLWLREGNLVILKPWSVQSNERGDIIYSYSNAQRDWLARKNLLPEEFR